MVVGHLLHVCFFAFFTPGYREAAVAGAVCVSLIIAAVLKCVHAAGFIFPKFSLPQTLVSNSSHICPLWLAAGSVTAGNSSAVL